MAGITPSSGNTPPDTNAMMSAQIGDESATSRIPLADNTTCRLRSSRSGERSAEGVQSELGESVDEALIMPPSLKLFS